MPINGHLYMEYLCCQEFAYISEKRIKMHFRIWWIGGNYLKIDFFDISVYEFVDTDGPLDDNEPIHESLLHMHEANKTKAITCVLTVKLPFSHVETVDIMALLLCFTSGRLSLLPLQILQPDYSWASAVCDPNIIFLFNGLNL